MTLIALQDTMRSNYSLWYLDNLIGHGRGDGYCQVTAITQSNNMKRNYSTFCCLNKRGNGCRQVDPIVKELVIIATKLREFHAHLNIHYITMSRKLSVAKFQTATIRTIFIIKSCRHHRFLWLCFCHQSLSAITLYRSFWLHPVSTQIVSLIG